MTQKPMTPEEAWTMKMGAMAALPFVAALIVLFIWGQDLKHYDNWAPLLVGMAGAAMSFAIGILCITIKEDWDRKRGR